MPYCLLNVEAVLLQSVPNICVRHGFCNAVRLEMNVRLRRAKLPGASLGLGPGFVNAISSRPEVLGKKEVGIMNKE